ncbi:lysylphosphatidylglycerol synthase transmembrane domain-containing protein [Oryzicola mucosus]|uniref:Flippase-like domain-containing protein n=1 Tax=Oryzicola mucosus TaxID=2767425 RepID=A0A8J6TYT3_9HYPH|nr:lysylphosphatidylglycerol synthase transmembrane domain-containing protein [Oryzicola mucosus]MBD0415299.1 flippase-like domain-containing protein [Oryzicola mucosus]
MPGLRIVTAVASIAVVIGLVLFIEPAGVFEAFQSVSAGHVVLGLGLVQAQIVLSAVRWRFTAARLGQTMSLSLAIREYYIASLLNQTLPGGMAGDALRAYRGRTETEGGWKRPAQAVVFERLSGQFAFFALTALSLLAWPLLLSPQMPEGFGAAMGVAAMVVAALLLAWLWRGSLPARFAALKPDFAVVFWQDGAAFVQIGLSAVVVASYVTTFFIASGAVGAPLPWVAAVTVVPLCLLAMLVPSAIGGWGTREAAAAALWPILGFTAGQGLSASLLYGVISLAGALPGLGVLAFAAWRGGIGRA